MDQPFIIGITGGSGSGKTTFIRALEEQMNGASLCIVSQDEYYKDREEQRADEFGILNFDLPSAIDEGQLERDINRLARGEEVSRMEYTFNNSERTARKITYQPASVLVVEGLYVMLNPALKEMMDLTIFIHARDNVKVIRRIKRDREERNYSLEDVLYRYENHVMPSYEQHIKPFSDEVDLIINNNKSFHRALKVLCGFLHFQRERTDSEKSPVIDEVEKV